MFSRNRLQEGIKRYEAYYAANPDKMSEFLKHWAAKLDALSSGITQLKEYHL